jgi:hypothetical protein
LWRYTGTDPSSTPIGAENFYFSEQDFSDEVVPPLAFAVEVGRAFTSLVPDAHGYSYERKALSTIIFWWRFVAHTNDL